MFATRTLIVSSILSCLSVVSVIAEPTTRFPTSFNDQEAILVNYASNTVLDINMEDLGTPPDQYVHMWTMAPRWTHQLWHLILLDAANGIWALQNNYTGCKIFVSTRATLRKRHRLHETSKTVYLEFPNVSSTPNIQAQAYQYNSTSDPDFASAQWQIYISDDDGMRKYVS